MEKRESWGSRFGFIMAAAGFSVGLGNIWRFPYLTGENGGGAFLLVYLLISLIIGIPLFVMEMTLGRKAKQNPIGGMKKLTKKNSIWNGVGWVGLIATFVILTYYIQIMGWVLAYLFKFATGQLSSVVNGDFAGVFEAFTSNTGLVSLCTIICSIIIGVISAKGLEDGVEKACKILMPTLFIMLILLSIRSLTLPGASKGLKWYLSVDFSKINASVVLTALGQVFFSIGIGCSSAFVYGSYLEDNSDIPTDAIIVVGMDVFIAFIAGIVMFPAIFAYGLSPDSGPDLLFVTMSNLFSQMPGGAFFGAMFFLLIFFAALSSALGYLEPLVLTATEELKMDRKKGVWISLLLIFIVGFPTILAQGPWSHILIGGRNLFDFADFLSGNILMTIDALLIAFFVAFVWKFENFQQEANIGAIKNKVFDWWAPLIKVVVPLALAIIFITGLF